MIAALARGMLLFAIAGALHAAERYPVRVITIVVPFAASGPADTIGRLLAAAMSAALGGRIIVETIGGAGGTLGAAHVARAARDGYTLLLHHVGHATALALYRRLPYDPIEDFAPIGRVVDVPMALVANRNFAARDFRELAALMKSGPRAIRYAHAGAGSASHLCGVMLMSAMGPNLATVSYKGTGRAINDLLAGDVELMCDQTANVVPHVRAGAIRVFAVTTTTRLAPLKEVPTLHELGLEGFDLAVWYGLYAPRKTPAEIVERLRAALQGALKAAAFRARLIDLGAEAVAEAEATPAALQTKLKREIDRWAPLIKRSADPVGNHEDGGHGGTSVAFRS